MHLGQNRQVVPAEQKRTGNLNTPDGASETLRFWILNAASSSFALFLQEEFETADEAAELSRAKADSPRIMTFLKSKFWFVTINPSFQLNKKKWKAGKP